jgi:hypothetical protein
MNQYLDYNTSFITPEGYCSFRHFRSGQKVQVLTQNLTWASGTVLAFGRKPLHLITFESEIDGECAEIYTTLESRWLLKPQGSFKYKANKQSPPKYMDVKHINKQVTRFGLQTDDKVQSVVTNIFNGDEVMFSLYDRKYKVINIHEDFKTCDAWGIELKEDFFFTLSNNILFGSY